MELEAIYIADAMCSWCWGFAPVSRALADAIERRASLRVVPGALALGTRAALLPGEAEQMMTHWRQVHEATGQPFDFSRPVDHHTVYDSTPPCRAMALTQLMRPEAALDMLHTLQRAFYVERRDLADPAVLADCAAACGLPRDTFLRRLTEPATGAALDEALDLVHALGVRGFPAVALRSDARVQLLTLGYRDWSELAPHVQNWLQQK